MDVSDNIYEIAGLLPLFGLLHNGEDAVSFGLEIAAGEVALSSLGEQAPCHALFPGGCEELLVRGCIDDIIAADDEDGFPPALWESAQESATHSQIQIFLFDGWEGREKRGGLWQIVRPSNKDDVRASRASQAFDLHREEVRLADGKKCLLSKGPEALGTAGKE